MHRRRLRRPDEAETLLIAATVGNVIVVGVWPGRGVLSWPVALAALGGCLCIAALRRDHTALLGLVSLAGVAAIWTLERESRIDAEQAELALLAGAALASAAQLASRRRERMAARAVSRELIDGMTVIRGNVELLGRQSVDADVTRVREVVMDEIERMSVRLDGIEDT